MTCSAAAVGTAPQRRCSAAFGPRGRALVGEGGSRVAMAARRGMPHSPTPRCRCRPVPPLPPCAAAATRVAPLSHAPPTLPCSPAARAGAVPRVCGSGAAAGGRAGQVRRRRPHGRAAAVGARAGQGPTREQRLAALFNAACVHASFGDLELAQIPLKDGEPVAPACVHGVAVGCGGAWVGVRLSHVCVVVNSPLPPSSPPAAIYGGLDFQQAMSGADPTYVRLKASAQVLIQLRKFNEQVLKAKAGGGAAAPPKYASSASGAAAGGGSRASGKGVLGRDMSDVLSTGEHSGVGVWMWQLPGALLHRRGGAHAPRQRQPPMRGAHLASRPAADAESIDASIGGIIKRVVVLLLALSGLGVALWFGGMKYMMVD